MGSWLSWSTKLLSTADGRFMSLWKGSLQRFRIFSGLASNFKLFFERSGLIVDDLGAEILDRRLQNILESGESEACLILADLSSHHWFCIYLKQLWTWAFTAFIFNLAADGERLFRIDLLTRSCFGPVDVLYLHHCHQTIPGDFCLYVPLLRLRQDKV